SSRRTLRRVAIVSGRFSTSRPFSDSRTSRKAALIRVWYPTPCASAFTRNCSMTSSSSMMVIRVFPGEGITAPRLPFEKSYSLRMVLLRFTGTRLARRDHTSPVAARRVDDHKYSTECVHSERDETCFVPAIRVLDGHCMHISKCLLRV